MGKEEDKGAETESGNREIKRRRKKEIQGKMMNDGVGLSYSIAITSYSVRKKCVGNIQSHN